MSPIQHPLADKPPATDFPLVHLGIGECIFTSRPLLLCTVLGSCVAVTFHHPPSQATGFFHAMLPKKPRNKPAARPCTYSDSAVALLVERFKAKGIGLAALNIRIFGGAYTMPTTDPRLGDSLDVGRQNVEEALRALARYGLKPEAEHILGDRGRKVFIETSSGRTVVTWVSDQDIRELQRP